MDVRKEHRERSAREDLAPAARDDGHVRTILEEALDAARPELPEYRVAELAGEQAQQPPDLGAARVSEAQLGRETHRLLNDRRRLGGCIVPGLVRLSIHGQRR